MQISLEPIVVVVICIVQHFNCVRELSVIVVRLAVSAGVVFGNWSTCACQNRNNISNHNILLKLSALFDEEVTARNMSLNKRPVPMIVRPTLLALNITFIFPCKIWCSRVSPGYFCRFNLNLPTNSCWAIPHLVRSDVRQYRVPYIFQVNHSSQLEDDPRNFLHGIGFLILDNARLTSCQFLSLIQRPCRESRSMNWLIK